jgi:hypothetical protein
MKDKRWAKISAFVGILGGPLALFFLLSLFAAGLGASRSGAMLSLALLVTTFGIIFFVALKSAHYYKEDERVNQVIANLFVASSGVGFVISLLIGSANVPIVSEVLDWIMFAVFDGSDGFERALMLMFLSSILSVVWGIYYAICLRKFKELD